MKKKEEIKYHYYCLKEIASDDKLNFLKKPLTIFKFKADFPFVPNYPYYESLEELRKKDTYWREYHSKDPKSANKIYEERFIVKPIYGVLSPIDKEFDRISYKILKHTLFGELVKKDIAGIHFISRSDLKTYVKIDCLCLILKMMPFSRCIAKATDREKGEILRINDMQSN